MIDHDKGRVVSSPIELAEIARREVAGLDAIDCGLTEADFADSPAPVMRQARRRTAERIGRLK